MSALVQLGPRRALADLAWDLAGPCADCPFRRDAPDHEGVAASVVGYVEAMRAGTFAHTCHKTDNRITCDGPRDHRGPPQHCGGALHFLVRAGCDLQRPLAQAVDAGRLDIKAVSERARGDERVFASVDEFLRFYLGVAERVLAARRADPPVCVVDPADPCNKPVTMPLSVARAAGLDVLPCSACGGPATEADRLWPWHQDRNFCDRCCGGATERAVEELRADVVAAGGEA